MPNPQKSALPWIWGAAALCAVFLYATRSPEKPTASLIDVHSAPTSNALDPSIVSQMRAESEKREAQDSGHDNQTSGFPTVPPEHWGKGHQAGYDWAMDHPEVTEDDCIEAGLHSNSPSFEEGCKSAIFDKAIDGADAAANKDEPN